MILIDKLRRPSALAVAALLVVAGLTPALSSKKVGAYGLLTAREIKLSSSANGSLAAGQDVTYAVSYVTGTTSNVGGVVIDFCSDSPIIGDTCTAPTGFNINEAGLALANQVGTGGNDFSVDAATVNNTLVLSRTVASISASTTVSFDLGAGGGTDGVTNPTNVNTTFYARILTYATLAEAQAYVTGPTLGTPVDAGGIALSTAERITVTAKVQERLTFCVYTDGDGAGPNPIGTANTTNCTGVSGSDVTLGDTNGVLTDSGAYVNTHAMYNVSTNASSGATIRAKGSTLTSGLNTISAIGGGTAEAGSTPGTEQFGFCNYEVTATTLNIDADYDGFDSVTPGTDTCAAATHTSGTGTPGGTGTDVQFTFITANLSSTYGDAIAVKPAGAQSTARLAFMGNIATVTEPGIYQSILTFIATGNY